MTIYRKRPVAIEAWQWDGTFDGAFPIVEKMDGGSATVERGRNGDITFTINTLEGPMFVSPNDFIIKGIKGEFYPCKPDIFASSYEEIVHA